MQDINLSDDTPTSIHYSIYSKGYWNNQFKDVSKLQIAFITLVILTALVTAILVLIVIVSISLPAELIQDENLIIASTAAVTSDSETCSIIGNNILQNEGNAMDATIAITFCLGVLHPFTSGVGGGAIILIRSPDGTTDVIDGRELSPSAQDDDDFYEDTKHFQTGVPSIAVPGQLLALYLAYEKYSSGKFDWKELVRPSIALAYEMRVDAALTNAIRKNMDVIKSSNELSSIFLNSKNAPLVEGSTINRPRLANTLEKIAESGIGEFYSGEITASLFEDLKSLDDDIVITEEDFQNYGNQTTFEPFQKAISTFFLGTELITVPGAHGGAILNKMMNYLERFNLPLYPGIFSDTTMSFVLEAQNFGFAESVLSADWNFLSDQKKENMMYRCFDKRYAAILRQNYNNYFGGPTKVVDNFHAPSVDYYFANTSDIPSSIPPSREDEGGAHVNVVDKDRMAVSLTTSLNSIWGAGVMSAKTGIIFNNALADFNVNAPDSIDRENIILNNFGEPNKKPASPWMPLIVTKDNDLYAVFGGEGGDRILSSVFLVLVNVLGWDVRIDSAIAFPRAHVDFPKRVVLVETGWKNLKGGADDQLVRGVERRGWTIEWVDEGLGAAHGIVVSTNGTLFAVADSRAGGMAAGY